jgi:Pyruvate/2-oxoacid:ferredoxin oxidoreductase delta subunit
MQTKDTHAKRDYRDKIILDYHFILDLIIDYFMLLACLICSNICPTKFWQAKTLIMVLLAKLWQAGKKMR